MNKSGNNETDLQQTTAKVAISEEADGLDDVMDLIELRIAFVNLALDVSAYAKQYESIHLAECFDLLVSASYKVNKEIEEQQKNGNN